MAAKIRRDDTVLVIAGKDKGKQGRVLRMSHDGRRVVVEKVNMIKRHTRPTAQQQAGGIIEREAPIDVSNVMLVDPASGLPIRPKFRLDEATGQKTRVNPKTGLPVE